MNININIEGIEQVRQQLGSMARQANFAASQALNSTAFSINKRIKDDMQAVFKGGATPYSLQAFRVEKSTKATLQASVMLRTDAPAGSGTPYNKALGHLFSGGTRNWKRLEGYLRGRALMPAGVMAVPGRDCPLDARGNIRQATLNEMLGSLSSSRAGMRIYRKSGGGKAQKAVGYFVVQINARSHLKPGIYKRIETGGSSVIKPMVMYVKPGTWRQFLNLQRIGQEEAGKFQAQFNVELSKALGSAR